MSRKLLFAALTILCALVLSACGPCKHERTYVWHEKQPTCESEGYTGDIVCEDCGETVQKGESIPPAGHTPSDVLRHQVNPTCTEEGYSGDPVCSVCGKTLITGEAVPPLGHQYGEAENARPASCIAPGYSGDRTCTVCGAFEQGEVLPVADHRMENGACAVCGWRTPGLYADGQLEITWEDFTAMGYAAVRDHALTEVSGDLQGKMLVIGEDVTAFEAGEGCGKAGLAELWLPRSISDIDWPDQFGGWDTPSAPGRLAVFSPVPVIPDNYFPGTEIVIPDGSETIRVTIRNVGVEENGFQKTTLYGEKLPDAAEGEEYFLSLYYVCSEAEEKASHLKWSGEGTHYYSGSSHYVMPDEIHAASEKPGYESRCLIWRKPETPEGAADASARKAEPDEADGDFEGRTYRIGCSEREKGEDGKNRNVRTEYEIVFHDIRIGDNGVNVFVSGPRIVWADWETGENRIWLCAEADGKKVSADSRSGGFEGECVFYFNTLTELPDAVYLESRSILDERIRIWKKKTGNNYVPGGIRQERGYGWASAASISEQYGTGQKDGILTYTPSNPCPMNAYMAVGDNSEIGVDGQDIFRTDVRGISNMTGYLKDWMDAIEEQSGRAIRFVSDPDDAELLFIAELDYPFHGNYQGGGFTSKGYSCRLWLAAVRLTDPPNLRTLTLIRNPKASVNIRKSEKFWELPPEIAGTPELESFVNNILSWYGFRAEGEPEGDGADAIRRALTDRGLLAGASGSGFDSDAEAAVRKLQKEYGLEETGEVDEKTLIAVYYGREALE